MVASAYAKSTTVITPKQIAALDKSRRNSGFYIPAPTKAELLRRRNYLKTWYQVRDFMFVNYVSMARLENPFSSSKTAIGNKETHMENSGKIKTTIDTQPHDALTLMMSIPADKHPYVTTRPTHKAHTPVRMDEFDRFAQGSVDTLISRNDFQTDMFSKLGVYGWLPTLTTFDQALQKQGEFPFDLEVLDPLNFYPHLDGKRRPTYAFLEYKVNGAQLLQSFSMFAGVMEMFEAEDPPTDPDSDAYDDYWQDGNNIWTTDFEVSIYYDDTYKCILVGATDPTEAACRYNSFLKYKKDDYSKGRMSSVMHGSESPYEGIEAHHLGGLPINLEGCWPEPVSPTVQNTSSSYSTRLGNNNDWGRLVYYPWLFSMRNNWMDQTKLRDMMYSWIELVTDPVIKYYTQNVKNAAQVKNQKVVPLNKEDGEDFEYAPPPPFPSFILDFQAYIDNQMKKGNIDILGNARSARQAAAQERGGTIRVNPLIRAVERSISQVPKHIVRILEERGGDEEVFVHGNGDKWGEDGYIQTYKVEDLKGVVPDITCRLKPINGLKDLDSAAAFTSLAQTKKFSDEDLMRDVLDIASPKTYIERAKKEFISADTSVIKPQVEIAALEAEGEAIDQKWELTEKNQLKIDQHQHEMEVKQAEQDFRQLPEDERAAKVNADIQKAIAAAQGQPDPTSSGSKMPMANGNGPLPMSTPPMPSANPLPMPTNSFGGNMISSERPPGMPMNLPIPSSAAGLPSQGMRMPIPLPGSMVSTGPTPPMALPMGGRPPGMPANIPPPAQRPPIPFGAGLPMSGAVNPLNSRPPLPAPRPTPSGIPSDFAKAPGQRDRGIQPLTAYQPKGGVGRPGVPPGMIGPQGLSGQAISTPGVEAANAAMPSVNKRRRKRGRRG